MLGMPAAAVDFAALADRFVVAQLAGDRREAYRLVVEEALSLGACVVDVQSKVIRVAQDRIGTLWETNQISIAQEHLATGISQVVMARLYDCEAPPRRNGKHIAMACVEGELHDMPARLVADYLDYNGFAVRYFGASVPPRHLVTALQAEPVDLCALSATMTFHAPALREAVTAIRAALPALPIVVGGRAAGIRGLADSLGVTAAPADPDELVPVIKKLVHLHD